MHGHMPFWTALAIAALAAVIFTPHEWLTGALRAAGRALGATGRYLLTAHKGCPGCARARARAEASHPARRAARAGRISLSDEEVRRRFDAIKRAEDPQRPPRRRVPRQRGER